MVTREQFNQWLETEDMCTAPVEHGVKFDCTNPWDEIYEDSELGTVRLVDGTIHIDWVDGGWNGYGEEQFTDITEFAERFTDVMENGL